MTLSLRLYRSQLARKYYRLWYNYLIYIFILNFLSCHITYHFVLIISCALKGRAYLTVQNTWWMNHACILQETGMLWAWIERHVELSMIQVILNLNSSRVSSVRTSSSRIRQKHWTVLTQSVGTVCTLILLSVKALQCITKSNTQGDKSTLSRI